MTPPWKAAPRWLRATALIVAAGAVAAAAAQLAQPPRLYVEFAPSLAVGLVTLATAAAVVAGALLARSRRVAVERAATEAAARAHEHHRRFLLRLDHEVKNPLTAIRAGLANLEQLPYGDEPALAVVRSQTMRLTRLLADLRKLAELESRPLETEVVDVADLLTEATSAVRELPEAADRDVRLSLPTAPWPLPPVVGDRDVLFLAVHNLLVNAVKFSAPGDTVEVRAVEEDNALRLSVADTGMGVPDEESDLVWEELARGRGAQGRPGTGIGLALVRTVARRHGGNTELRSRPGQGTVVTITVPVARP